MCKVFGKHFYFKDKGTMPTALTSSFSSVFILGFVFLIDDWCGKDQLMIGDVTPGLLVL